MAKKGPIIYRRLVMVMVTEEMTRKEVAYTIGVSYNTLHNKLCGHTSFTLDEALLIKQLLKFPGTLEELFKKCDYDSQIWNNRKG